MNKTELVKKVAEKAGLTNTEALKVVNATFDAINEGLVADKKVVLVGFGTFEVRERAARTGTNPRTGEKMKIKASKAPAFKPGKAMKELVNVKKGKKK